MEGQNCDKELKNNSGVGSICTLDAHAQQVFELVIVNALVIRPISSLEDGVSYVAVNFVGDGLCCLFFCANGHLIEEIDVVGFFLGVRSCGDGGRKQGAVGEIVSMGISLASSRTDCTVATVVVVISDRSLTLEARPDILHLGLIGL